MFLLFAAVVANPATAQTLNHWNEPEVFDVWLDAPDTSDDDVGEALQLYDQEEVNIILFETAYPEENLDLFISRPVLEWIQASFGDESLVITVDTDSLVAVDPDDYLAQYEVVVWFTGNDVTVEGPVLVLGPDGPEAAGSILISFDAPSAVPGDLFLSFDPGSEHR